MKTLSKVIIALLGSSMAISCSYMQPKAENANENAPSLSKCEQNATIDDFDDADAQIKVVEGRGEYIYTYADALGTSIEFPSGDDFRPYPGGVGASKFIARFRGYTAKSGGDIFAGIGFGLASGGAGTPYDASKYTGVSFIAKRGSTDSAAVVRLNIADVNTDPEGKVCTECYNHFGTPIKLADQWTRYVIFFDELEQRAGWGNPRPASVDTSGLLGMSWQYAIPNSKFDLEIDDIRFIGACNEEYAKRAEEPKAEVAPPPPAVEPAQALSPAQAPTDIEPIEEIGPDNETTVQ
ncbi:MAG: hypothetical protein JXR91_01215 [Deltaproteobacteria bacterium]|nr:hypothetical protein [Deltaproteobacteria bacterium]